ncbi:MAG: rRNA maturation RNase YbeY [Clostridiales bacterium]|nr:rRNA maturation RNase YbeY [Clostridiales bacterium]
MSVNIVCLKKPDFRFHYKDLAQKVAQAALDQEAFPYKAEISLTLTDDDDIHQMNREFREIDSATDVLSFPMMEYDEPGDYSFMEEELFDLVDPDTEEVLLGDIVISLDRVKAQADEYGHSEKREYAFLIAHSMLHLLGYDHMTPEEAAVMEKRQEMILDGLGITR